MGRLSGRPRADTTAVLIDTLSLADWLQLQPTYNANTTEAAHPQPREGFVAAEPAPSAGQLVLLDVRWSAQQPGEGHEQYRQGHVPGAVFVSMSGQLSGHGGPQLGRHPLPDPSRFTDSVRMMGINDEDTIVVYDDVSSAAAPRAWWLLRHAGFEKVYVLDGGLRAWRDHGLPLQAGEVLPVFGTAHTSWGRMPVVDTDEMSELTEAGVVTDARTGERYRGEQEPLDPVAGHIPGALSVPADQMMTEDGRFLPANQLRELFAAHGIGADTAVASYCGSGVSASGQVLAHHLAGKEAALYPGSWSAWCNTPGRQVATGGSA